MSGLAHIEFYSGATVILEGPADLELISSTEAFCSHGKLRATIPPQAHGFTVRSPRLQVVDRGTEFGLLVGDSGRTEVHVFQGKVEWSGAGQDQPAARPSELTTGRAVRLEGKEPARPIASDPAAFVSAGDLKARLQAELLRRQQEWTATCEDLRKDLSLEVYYTFQGDQSVNRLLCDQALARPQPRDGVIIGCTWAPGRWPGRQGLEFKRVSDRVRFRVPGTFGSMTLLTWVRVDALPNRFNALMHTDAWTMGTPHWHISDEGKIALGVHGGKGKKGYDHRTSEVFTPDRLGQWAHLAVVYDRTDGRVTHYVDGRSVAEEPMRYDVMLRIGDVELGNWNVASRRNEPRPIRFFSGCMDEFLLFSRALGEDEVRHLYTRGRPPM
jgi:hypothetical protein